VQPALTAPISASGYELCRGSRSNAACDSGPLLGLEALAAEDGPTLGGLEGDCRLDAALRAFGARLCARETSCSRTRARTHPDAGAPGFAGLAAFRVVFELFVEEKELFAGSEDELTTAICAG